MKSKIRFNEKCRARHWLLSPAAALGLLIALAACGGGGGDGGGPDPAVDPVVAPSSDPDAHAASLDAIGAAYDQLAQTDPAADGEALLAMVKTLPDVREAGIAAPGNVWLTFNDGISTFISTQPLYTPAEAAIVAAAAAEAARTPSGPAATQTSTEPRSHPLDTKLPGEASPDLRHAYLIDSASRGLTKVSRVDTMQRWFERKKFTVHAFDNKPEAAVFKTIKDASVAHLLTHGSVGLIEGRRVFGLSIGLETAEPKNLAFYRNEIEVTHEMGYMVLPEPHEVAAGSDPKKQRMGRYLYITPKFVRNNMSFTEGSLVFLNGCATFSADAADMVQAFKDKHASTVLGWSGVTSHGFAIDSALFLFDRLLSANEHVGYAVQQPNRPFTVSEVLDHMKRYAHVQAAYPPDYAPDAPHDLTLTQSVFRVYREDDKYTEYNATLMPDTTQGYEGLALVPAINDLFVENLADRLTLRGNFGTGPSAAGAGTRKVTLDGQPLEVQSWNASAIVVVNVPRTGAGSSGALIVNVDGAESNPAYVDRWNGVVLKNYQPFPGGPGDGTGTAFTLVQCTVNLRGSSSSFRSEVDGELTLFASTDDAIIQDGACAYNASGEYYGAGYQVLFAVGGSPLLPWIAPAQRNMLDGLTRFSFVTAYISNGNLQFDLIARTRLSDGGGPRQTYRYNSTGQSATSLFELNSTGATSDLRSGYFKLADNTLLAGFVQQTLNLLTWSETQVEQRPPSAYAR